MAQKLMVDACVHWARNYRVDGFRFDLMGHHSRSNLLAVRAALDALTTADDGVDGRSITMYGEGWNFGEVADNARFVQATQGQLGGTGIATFSDRLRDAVRGGSVWDSDPRGQGFGTGLLTADNGSGVNGDERARGERLAWYTDLVQLGLAGNLRGFRFGSNCRHTVLRGADLDFGGRPAGYAEAPDEVINYVDAHDNETLFDALTLKLHPATPMAARVRLNTVCLALATLGQSPVMWHAGTDMLRSKSLDRNSYNSGDWFNYLDFTMTDNGFAAGLPPEHDNGHKWHVLAPLLADPRLKPDAAEIRTAHAQALDLLRLRASTRLFRLGTAELVQSKLTFPVANSWHQLPGVIVMAIDDRTSPVDERWSGVLAIFNATPWLVRQTLPLDLTGYVLSGFFPGGTAHAPQAQEAHHPELADAGRQGEQVEGNAGAGEQVGEQGAGDVPDPADHQDPAQQAGDPAGPPGEPAHGDQPESEEDPAGGPQVATQHVQQLDGCRRRATRGQRGVQADVESGREQGCAGEDRHGVDRAERCDRAGGEGVDAPEETVEPHGDERLGDHDTHLEDDSEARKPFLPGEVGQGRGGVAGHEELVADDHVAEQAGDGQAQVEQAGRAGGADAVGRAHFGPRVGGQRAHRVSSWFLTM